MTDLTINGKTVSMDLDPRRPFCGPCATRWR